MVAAVLKKICYNSIVSPKCVPTTHTHNLTGKRIEPSTEACLLKENQTPVWMTAESSTLTKTGSLAPSRSKPWSHHTDHPSWIHKQCISVQEYRRMCMCMIHTCRYRRPKNKHNLVHLLLCRRGLWLSCSTISLSWRFSTTREQSHLCI
jgi:hypothetical protein